MLLYERLSELLLYPDYWCKLFKDVRYRFQEIFAIVYNLYQLHHVQLKILDLDNIYGIVLGETCQAWICLLNSTFSNKNLCG